MVKFIISPSAGTILIPTIRDDVIASPFFDLHLYSPEHHVLHGRELGECEVLLQTPE
jgi:hypothetical protein